MRKKSHRQLGEYLIHHHLPSISHYQSVAFLLGCVEPDQNPFTYLKGSLRHQCLKGHNYQNARRYIRQLSWRLEKKASFSLYDYYSLGKLMHYIADAFTYAHNKGFHASLRQHRLYEITLQEYFIAFLPNSNFDIQYCCYSPMEILHYYHREYCKLKPDIHTDTIFAVKACSCILRQLQINKICL